jgi:hypothetical protein
VLKNALKSDALVVESQAVEVEALDDVDQDGTIRTAMVDDAMAFKDVVEETIRRSTIATTSSDVWGTLLDVTPDRLEAMMAVVSLLLLIVPDTTRNMVIPTVNEDLEDFSCVVEVAIPHKVDVQVEDVSVDAVEAVDAVDVLVEDALAVVDVVLTTPIPIKQKSRRKALERVSIPMISLLTRRLVKNIITMICMPLKVKSTTVKNMRKVEIMAMAITDQSKENFLVVEGQH